MSPKRYPSSMREHAIIKIRQLLEADDRLRSLKRRALQSGDEQAWEAYENALVSAGYLPRALKSKADRVDIGNLRSIEKTLDAANAANYDLVLHAHGGSVSWRPRGNVSFIITRVDRPHEMNPASSSAFHLRGHQLLYSRRGAEGGQSYLDRQARRLVEPLVWIDSVIDLWPESLTHLSGQVTTIRFFVIPVLHRSVHGRDWV